MEISKQICSFNNSKNSQEYEIEVKPENLMKLERYDPLPTNRSKRSRLYAIKTTRVIAKNHNVNDHVNVNHGVKLNKVLVRNILQEKNLLENWWTMKDRKRWEWLTCTNRTNTWIRIEQLNKVYFDLLFNYDELINIDQSLLNDDFIQKVYELIPFLLGDWTWVTYVIRISRRSCIQSSVHMSFKVNTT